MDKLTLLKTTYNKISKRVGASLARKGVGITEGQYRYLGAIYEESKCLRDIAIAMGSGPNIVSRMYPALIAAGYIKERKNISNGDRRYKEFQITIKGKKVFDKAAPLVEAALTLSREDFLGLAKELRK